VARGFNRPYPPTMALAVRKQWDPHFVGATNRSVTPPQALSLELQARGYLIAYRRSEAIASFPASGPRFPVLRERIFAISAHRLANAVPPLRVLADDKQTASDAGRRLDASEAHAQHGVRTN
jgi:hypothetical protein